MRVGVAGEGWLDVVVVVVDDIQTSLRRCT